MFTTRETAHAINQSIFNKMSSAWKTERAYCFDHRYLSVCSYGKQSQGKWNKGEKYFQLPLIPIIFQPWVFVYDMY